MNTTAVIYARVSSVGDRQCTDRQVEDLMSYANNNSLNVEATFTEHISGAVKNEQRHELQDCLSYCVGNGVGTILMSELSRCGRCCDEVLATVRYCKEHQLNIYFQKEGLSIFQSDGKPNPFLNIFISVLGTCAELERDAIKFRLASGRAKAIKDGVKMGRKVGYRKPTEEKKTEYKSVLRELRAGTSVRKTAKICGVGVSTVQRLKLEFGM